MRIPRTLVLLASLTTIVACGAGETAPPRHARTRLATATDEPLTRRAPLHYEIRGRPFPLPLVGGRIAGHPVLMLVDTGANSHVIAASLARKIGLSMKKLGDIGTDHVGKPIATYRIDKLDMSIDGWGKLSATTALATEIPDVIEKLGIGAFISPQRLDEEGDSVVLDLRKAEIRSAWWDQARLELDSVGVPLVQADHGKVCEENEGPVKGLAFVVPTIVDGHRVELLVDTGAQHSDVFTSSAAGRSLVARSMPAREPMYTASGRVSARKLNKAHIATGDVSITTDIDLIEGAADGSCPRDGALAMDVLRSCELLLGRSKIYGRCAEPAGTHR